MRTSHLEDAARHHRSGRVNAVTCLTAVLLVIGCGDDDPAGPGGDDDQTGRIEAVVTDDPQSSSPAVVGGDLAASRVGLRTLSGTVEGDFRVSISADGQSWVDLGSLNGITATLQSSGQSTVHGEQSVAAGTYTRVRLIIDGADAELAAGSQIGGLTLTLDTSVSIGNGGQVVVVRTVPEFTVRAEATTRIAFDLNSEMWLTESAVTLGTAAAADVESQVTAAVVAG